jgi:hypothetical protein
MKRGVYLVISLFFLRATNAHLEKLERHEEEENHEAEIQGDVNPPRHSPPALFL